MTVFASLVGWGFEVVGFVAIAAVGLYLLLRFLNKGAAGNAAHYAQTQVGKVGGWFAEQDPAAQMRQAAINAGAELHDADVALIEAERLSKGLARQITEDTRKRNNLETKTAQLLREGASETDPRIVDNARRIAELEKTIAENSAQIDSAQKAYAATLKNANSASRKIKGAMDEADRLKVDLALGEQAVKLTQMFQKYDPSKTNSNLAKIDQYRQEAQKAKDGNAATLKVMADRAEAFTDDADDAEIDASSPEVEGVMARLRAKAKPPVQTTGS
jgi:phage shock protein A